MKLPKISLVTPSFNQGKFIEETLTSVLDQSYPALEYIVIDGGSTDGAVEILKGYSDRLAFWTSEKDAGQYDAINKGFARASGEVFGWINSDDKLLPWALQTVGDIFATHPQIEWLTTLFPFGWDSEGKAATCRAVDGYSREGFLRGENLPLGGLAGGFPIQQESTFWRRSLWERAGGKLNLEFKLAGDFELWTRFFAQGAELYGVGVPLGGFRYHNEQRSAVFMKEYAAEAERALAMHGGKALSTWDNYRLGKSKKRKEYWERKRQKLLRDASPVRLCLHACQSGGWQIHSR